MLYYWYIIIYSFSIDNLKTVVHNKEGIKLCHYQM